MKFDSYVKNVCLHLLYHCKKSKKGSHLKFTFYVSVLLIFQFTGAEEVLLFSYLTIPLSKIICLVTFLSVEKMCNFEHIATHVSHFSKKNDLWCSRTYCEHLDKILFIVIKIQPSPIQISLFFL